MTKANMLWIFVLAFIMPISLDAVPCNGGSCELNGDCCKPTTPPPVQKPNLALVTWAHAVNSQSLLNIAIGNDGIKMIEADVIMGTVVAAPSTEAPEDITPEAPKKPETFAAENDNANANEPGKNEQKPTENQAAKQVPIMGHPPDQTSDLSFEKFVDVVSKHNSKAPEKKTKGVKLDFKTIKAVQNALPLIEAAKLDLSPVWINADILNGPGSNTESKPVDAKAFLEAVKKVTKLNKATLSIGWTTNYVENAQYTDEHVATMLKTITDNLPKDDDKLHPITFPVRAAIAAQSKDALSKLVEEVEKMGMVATLTIWSSVESEADKIDLKKLQQLIDHVGLTKVYVDLDDKLKQKLRLVPATNAASSLVNFGLLNVATFLIAFFFRNGFY